MIEFNDEDDDDEDDNVDDDYFAGIHCDTFSLPGSVQTFGMGYNNDFDKNGEFKIFNRITFSDRIFLEMGVCGSTELMFSVRHTDYKKNQDGNIIYLGQNEMFFTEHSANKQVAVFCSKHCTREEPFSQDIDSIMIQYLYSVESSCFISRMKTWVFTPHSGKTVYSLRLRFFYEQPCKDSCFQDEINLKQMANGAFSEVNGKSIVFRVRDNWIIGPGRDSQRQSFLWQGLYGDNGEIEMNIYRGFTDTRSCVHRASRYQRKSRGCANSCELFIEYSVLSIDNATAPHSTRNSDIGVHTYKDHVYYLPVDRLSSLSVNKPANMTWSDAQEFCESLNMHLLTITGIEEAHFLKTTFARMHYIIFVSTLVYVGLLSEVNEQF